MGIPKQVKQKSPRKCIQLRALKLLLGFSPSVKLDCYEPKLTESSLLLSSQHLRENLLLEHLKKTGTPETLGCKV
jgi:hypothetical protein